MSIPGEQSLARAQELFNAVTSVEELLPIVGTVIRELLKRTEDQVLRDRTLDHVRQYFGARLNNPGDTKDLVWEARVFCAEVVALIVRVRPKRGDPRPEADEVKSYFATNAGIQAPAAPISGRAGAPTSIVVVAPPAAEAHHSFDRLLSAALRHRVGIVTSFFQRWNLRVVRDMPLPFLLSVPFSQRLDQVIEALIIPSMLGSRSIQHLASQYAWDGKHSEEFWDIVRSGGHFDSVARAWHAAWDGLRPREITRKTADGSESVLRIGPGLRRMRQILRCEEYAIPEIRAREIDLLASFIEPDFGRAALEQAWTKLRQTYEQEMDPRIYQDRARTGALRDMLLACFAPFTNPTAEFLAMLCYWNFPLLSLHFLVTFTHNHGSNRAARLLRIPYLMWYLDLPEARKALESDNLRIAKAAANSAA